MKVIIFGADGYLGWPLALRLAAEGNKVIGIDNMATRRLVAEVGSDSALPILNMKDRVKAAKEISGYDMEFIEGDVTNYEFVYSAIKESAPDTIVHFAEQRTAPYSMIDVHHANYTMVNNITGTINLIYAMRDINPDIHLVKLGTMGEFGTPKFDIPEDAYVETEINGKRDRITVPKFAGSWYHWTKVHDTNNLLFANKLWGIRTTDVMQGPVYGTRTKEIIDERLHTRFDFDGVFGTVVNRYTAQAIAGIPLTPYGKGTQVRAFLSLEDSMRALDLLIKNPPERGAYRAVNQFMETLSMNEIAQTVSEAAKKLGINTTIQNVENPRVEAEQHHYNPERKILPSLGMSEIQETMDVVVGRMLKDLIPYKKRILEHKDVIMPRTFWRPKSTTSTTEIVRRAPGVPHTRERD